MKLLVATGFTIEGVERFMDDFYNLDSAKMTSVTIIPERKTSIEANRWISLCVILSAMNESIAEFLIDHTFNENGYMHKWSKRFKPMEEDEVKAIQFVEDTQIEELKDRPREKHFGWCDNEEAARRVASGQEFKKLNRYKFNDD